jgi:RES domain
MIERSVSEKEFENELSKLPSLEDFKKNLQELYSIDKSLLSIQEIKKLIFEKAIILPNFYSSLPKETINLLKTFRVRIEKSMTQTDDTNLIRTFSYPSPFFCSKNGRANLANHSVFYCSSDIGTALAESNLEIGDIAYLSVWKVNCDREVNYTAYLPTQIPTKNIWYKKAVDLYSQTIENAKKHGSDKSKHLEILYSFFAEIFIKESKPYSLTSWIANNILYDYDIVDLIVYPSFATNNYSCNIAIHPNFVDNYLRFEKIFKLQITGKPSGSVTFRISDSGTADRTSIIWKEVSQEEIDNYFPGAKKILSKKQ